jgi:hypothetical protein
MCSDAVLRELHHMSRSPNAQLVAALDHLRSQSDERTRPFDALWRHLFGDVVEALDHSLLVARLEAGIQQITNSSDNRIVAVDQLSECRLEGRLHRGESTHHDLEASVTGSTFRIRPREDFQRESVQGLDAQPRHSTAMAGDGPKQMMSEAA